jgi:hypothetical protein
MTEKLGNPDYYEVKQPDQNTRQLILQWFSRRCSNAVPTAAFHLVMLNTYFCATANLHYKHNLIEVTLLDERGKKLPGFETVYFPAHQVREWLQKHCTAKQRKKHCLSTLREQTANRQESLDDFYTYNV